MQSLNLNSLRKWHFVLLTLLTLEIGIVGHAWSHVDEDYAAAELARQRNEPAFVAPEQESLSADEPLAQQALAADEPLDQVGQWGPVTTWPFVFASAANLPDGRIIAWGGNNRTTFNGGSNTYTGIWDPTTGQIAEDNYAQHSMFCAIPTMRENGQVFVVGGDGTRERTSLFDYRTNNWQRIDDANIGRWYNGSLQLPNGQVFMALGSPGSRYPELWTEGSGWQWLTGIDLQGPILDYTADYGRPEWFPMLTVAPNGEILHVGPTPQMHYITPQGNGSIQETAAGITDWDANNQAGTMIMFDKGKILTLGGVSAKNRATIVDMNGTTPQVTAVNNLIQPRAHSNAVVLPTGEVFVVGGTSQDVWFSDQGTILTPEIWNPQTQLWREVADHAVPRNYHSVALLMPDGRVFSGGGGLCGCSADHPDHQIYSPSYLFNTDGTLATRPTITSATDVSTFGATVDVIATPNIQKFSMIKMSGTTHSHNTDVRFLNVPFSGDNGNYQLTLESNRNVLTPGYWMLFALNEQNVPSIAKVIQVVSEPPVSGAHQYVRFVADSEINGKPWTSMAELNVLDTNGNSLSQASWSVVSFDSEETVGEDGRAVNAIDGNPQTFWHTDWFANAGDDNDPAHPHEIVVNLGASYDLGGFQYLPRPGGGNGTVSAYRFYISTDGVNWGSPVAQGTFANNANEKTILFGSPPGNQAPVVTNPGNQTHVEGDVVNLPISASDADGDSLTYSATGLPAGLSINDGTGTITGIVTSAGTFAPTIGVDDGNGGSDNASFSWVVHPSNQPVCTTYTSTDTPTVLPINTASITSFLSVPTAATITDVNVGIDMEHAWVGDVRVTLSHLETGTTVEMIDRPGSPPGTAEYGCAGDDIRVVLDDAASDPVENQCAATSPTIDGTFSPNNALNAFDGENASGTWRLRVHDDYLEADGGTLTNWNVRICSNQGGSNQPPIITNPGPQNDQEGASISLGINATDADGDGLNYSATGLPDGLTINSSTGVISGTVAAGSAGVYAVTTSVNDGTDSVSVSFSWTVTGPPNQPPVITNPGNQTHMVSDSINLVISATDADGDPLTYSASGLPSGVNINSSTGTITGVLTSFGTFNTTVDVFDGNGGQDNTTFTWTISPITPITISPFTTSPQPTDQSITFTATASGGNGVLRYKWLFGDNTPETAYSTSATISHTFQNPGRYIVTVTVTDDSAQEVSQQLYQAIHRPFTANRPSSSMSVMYESRSGNDRVWAVNPDNNTVSVFDTITNSKVAEIGVGNEPRSLATAPDGRIWVANQDSATLSIIDQISLSVVNTVNLPSGSQPFGLLFDPSGNNGYLALQATGCYCSSIQATLAK